MATTRSVTVHGTVYPLQEHIPLAQYRQWAECNPLSLETGLPGLNAILAEPLTADDLDTMEAEHYFDLHRAIFDFFLGLRWGPSAPPPS